METTGTMPLGSTTTTTSISNKWNIPTRIEVNEVNDTIEIIYKQTPIVNYITCFTPNDRVYKIVFSCVDGKWNKSEPIFGEIIPTRGEFYKF